MENKSKGFTLIELIGVIAVLAIILLVALPTLTRTLRNSSNQEYENVLQDIFLAAEQYSLVYKEQFPQLEETGGRVTITLKTLKEAGYIDQHLENPKTGEEFSDSDYVLIEINDDYTREYKFNEGEATTAPDATRPTYSVEPGASVWTNVGKTVTIHYPNVNKNRYVFEYSLDGGLHWTVTQDIDTEVWFDENGYIIARVRDTYNERENLNGGVFQVTRIDKIPPTCVSSGGKTAWTSGSRTIVGTCSDTGGSGCKENIFYTYPGTSGQHYSITNAGPAGEGKAGTVYDNAGNSASCQANQTVRIDKKAPTCSVSQKANSDGASVTITGTCSDTGGSGCKGNVSRNVTSNGTYSPGTVYDNVNNSVTCSSITVTKVDTIAPSCPTITADHTAQKWTKDTVTLTIKPTSDTVSWDWYTNTNGGAWSDWGTNTGQKRKTLSGSGKRQGKIVVRDAAGNERTCTTSVYWVDKVKPYTPVISKITYSTGKGYTVSGVTSRKTQNNVSISFSAKNGYCSGKTKETWKVYGDTANANANSGYTIQAQMSCNGEDCYALIDGKKYNGGTGGKWITVSSISSINYYAGVAGSYDGKVITSKATWKIRLKDGAGNYSGVLTYTSNWCV